MPTSAVEVEGIEQFVRSLKDVDAKLERKVLRKAEKAGAGVAAKRARVKQPKKSGRLARSTRPGSSGKYGGVVRAGNKNTVKYARVQHFGWPARNIKPQPAVYKALIEEQDNIRDEFNKSLESLLKEAGLL